MSQGNVLNIYIYVCVCVCVCVCIACWSTHTHTHIFWLAIDSVEPDGRSRGGRALIAKCLLLRSVYEYRFLFKIYWRREATRNGPNYLELSICEYLNGQVGARYSLYNISFPLVLKTHAYFPVKNSVLCAYFFLIIGLCILLRVYQLNIVITSVRNKVFFGARFYFAFLTLHVSAPFGGHLQVVHKHKKYTKSNTGRITTKTAFTNFQLS
jgi:hypothetical protein